MIKTSFHFLNEASDLARTGSRLVFWAQQSKAEQKRYAMLLQNWTQVFSLSDVLPFGLGLIILIAMDLQCMFPLYRQVSQVISGNADLLPWYIGFGVNTVAVVCSHRLSKCALEGPFYNWEVWKNRDKPSEVAKYTVTQAQKSHVRHFVAMFLLYVVLLLAMLWMRSLLIQKSLITSLENLLTLVGLCFAFLAVLTGIYLVPLVQYSSWKIGYSNSDNQLSKSLKKISDIDQQIYLLWVLAGEPATLTKDIQDALTRHLFRANDANYIDPVSEYESELMACVISKKNSVRINAVIELLD